eukprot:2489908-Rhodomonas_salina.1
MGGRRMVTGAVTGATARHVMGHVTGITRSPRGRITRRFAGACKCSCAAQGHGTQVREVRYPPTR